MSLGNSNSNLLITCLIIVLAYFCTKIAPETATEPTAQNPKPSCALYKELGVNDLSLNDIVVKSSLDNTVCIKARFSLAIKVEAELANTLIETDSSDGQISNETLNGDGTESETIILGYLPLDTVIEVEDICPDAKIETPNGSNQSVIAQGEAREGDAEVEEDKPNKDELEMIVLFECGKLAFKFKREQNYFVSAIRGVVKLDSSNTIREFVAEQPMLFTSDLSHHFKFNELIEVPSTGESKAFILKANFYNLEFETFRETSSRDFIRPPDENSQPFQPTTTAPDS